MFSYNVKLSDFKDLPRLSWNLSRKMILRHRKTLWQPPHAGWYLTGPCLTFREICDTLKKTSQAFQGHEDYWKPRLRATSNVCRKIDESKEILLEIQHVLSSRGITFTCRVFLTSCELIHKFEILRNKTRSITTSNSWISKIFPGRAEISVGKWLSITDHSGSLYSRSHIS